MIEVKLGDYIETIDGVKGTIEYISKVTPCNIYLEMDNCYQSEWCYTREEFDKAIEDGVFKRIGSHDFTVKENKIEPFLIKQDDNINYKSSKSGIHWNINRKIDYTYDFLLSMGDKINEIIEYINKEDK